MAIGFSVLAAAKFPAGSDRFSPWVTIKSPHRGLAGGQASGVTPLKGERDIWALRLGEDRQLRTRALEGHKRARGRPHDHDVGVFGVLRACR